jgi:hypothetical protein
MMQRLHMMTPSTLRPILERLAYAVYLLLLVGSISAIWLGWLHGIATGEFRASIAGLGALALTRWLHVQGFAHWHFRECTDSLDALGAGEWTPLTAQEKARAVQIAALLDRLEKEEGVWPRAELRREITAHLHAAPTLRTEFAAALAAHPEL